MSFVYERKSSNIFYDVYVKIERKLRAVCKGLFFEGKMKVRPTQLQKFDLKVNRIPANFQPFENKINKQQITSKLMAKMRAKNMQGAFLLAKRRHQAERRVRERLGGVRVHLC